jgi:hypothetical protein
MKFSKLVFNLALLFVIATGFTLSSCSDRRLDEVRDPSPIAQLAMSVPDSDLSPEVLYSGSKNVKNPGFSVSVNKTSDCEMEGYDLPTTECVCLKKWYYLEFNQNYSFSDFQSYQVSKLDGTPTEWRVFPNEDGIYTNTPFIAKFQWSNANIGNPIPTAAQITDGGICIIGIVTDPRPPIQAPEPEGENE